jgi:ATP-dependent protease ClpP protease subunit
MFHGVTWGVATGQVTGQQARELVGNIAADEGRISAVIAERTTLESQAVEQFFREAATKDAKFALEHGFVQGIRGPQIPEGAPIVALTFPG